MPLDGLLGPSKLAFYGLRAAQQFKRLHRRLQGATEVAELMPACKSPWGGVIKRGATRDSAYLLFQAAQGVSKRFFPLT